MNFKRSYIGFVIPALIIFIFLYSLRGVPFEDDAYIFYRYAMNWALGYGPVFNIGEHVEGYSSFLWMAILALGSYLGFDPVHTAPILNLIISIICLILITYIVNLVSFSKPRLMMVMLPLFCALSYGFYYYGASGMDTIIFSLILMLCIISLYKCSNTEKYLYALPTLILLNLVRAEGFVYSIILVIVLVYFVLKKHDITKLPKQFIVMLSGFIGLTIMLFLLRYSYYNEWIPATVMAKGYGNYLLKKAILTGDYQAIIRLLRVIKSGIRYEFFFIFSGMWIPFIILIWNRKENNLLLWLIAFSIIVNIFVSVWAGGDYFPYQRHFVAVLPIAIILVAWAIDTIFRRYWKEPFFKKFALVNLLCLIIILWGIFFMKPEIFAKEYHEEGRSLYIRQIGLLLNEIPVKTTMLSQMIGKISYYAGINVYVRDILGLTDIHNAKYGDEWGFNWGKGVCGRTDFDYSFSTPFDIFFYNSKNMHKKFISFCIKNPSLCDKYRFFKTDEWLKTETYVIANINHPVSSLLKERFGAEPLVINRRLNNIVY